MVIDFEILKQYNEQGLISLRPSPDGKFVVANYTAKASFDRVWDEITLMCRGLVLEASTGKIVARPFAKFFNWEEVKDKLPVGEKFKIQSKMDGSLGVGFKYDGQIYICTRGAFESDQAIWAQNFFNQKYLNKVYDHISEGQTWLFEIIYPTNQIVVQYGGLEDLVLLAIIDNETGKDLPFNEEELFIKGFNVVKSWDFGTSDIETLKNMNLKNSEGFVLKYESGFRIKVKFEEYIRLHRVLTGISNKTVWEWLKNGDNFYPMLEKVPDEFYNWVQSQVDMFHAQYDHIASEVIVEYQAIVNALIKLGTPYTRKDFALMAQKSKYTSIMFAIADGKDYSKSIWEMIRPEFDRPQFKLELNSEDIDN